MLAELAVSVTLTDPFVATKSSIASLLVKAALQALPSMGHPRQPVTMDVYSKGGIKEVMSFYQVTHFANTMAHASGLTDSQRLPAPNRTMAPRMLSKRHR